MDDGSFSDLYTSCILQLQHYEFVLSLYTFLIYAAKSRLDPFWLVPSAEPWSPFLYYQNLPWWYLP